MTQILLVNLPVKRGNPVSLNRSKTTGRCLCMLSVSHVVKASSYSFKDSIYGTIIFPVIIKRVS